MTKLSKKICRKCWNEFARSRNRVYLLWNKTDEYKWQRGKVFCWKKDVMHTKHPNFHIGLDKIPDYCPYKLEHTVLSEKPE